MNVTAYKIRKMLPPKDDLLAAIKESTLSLKDGDIVCISSKVVSIGEGRCVPIEGTDKEALMRAEADWYMKAPKSSKWRRFFTISRGTMAGSAGIDESNANGQYVLYPKDAFKSAKKLRTSLMKEYGVTQLALIITDSTSLVMRRGAIGFALSWDGIDPLRDYRGTPDIFGRLIRIEMANIIDSLAVAAVLMMGEGSEQTPIAVIRGAENISFKNRPANKDQLMVAPDDDVFAPFFWNGKWKKGGGGKG
jgi:F420-0:gamma-glutamyl ligase